MKKLLKGNILIVMIFKHVELGLNKSPVRIRKQITNKRFSVKNAIFDTLTN